MIKILSDYIFNLRIKSHNKRACKMLLKQFKGLGKSKNIGIGSVIYQYHKEKNGTIEKFCKEKLNEIL